MGNKKMKKFTVGYNHDLDFFKVINKYKDYICGVYFPMPVNSGE